MRSLLLLLSLCSFASAASAGGIDLTVNACPQNPGAGHDAVLDCATGQTVSLLATFVPGSAMSDLIAIDVDLGVTISLGCDGPNCVPACDLDLGSSATFWNFSQNTTTSSHLRPAGCLNYVDTWNVGGGASLALGSMTDACSSRISAICYRPSPIAVAANDRLFGVLVVVDGSTAVEAGGTLTGCAHFANVTLRGIQPHAQSGNDGPALTNPALSGTSVHLNDSPVAVRATTWGRLKSLYR